MHRTDPSLSPRPTPAVARVRGGAWIRALRASVPVARPETTEAGLGGALGPALVVVVLPLPPHDPADDRLLP